MQYIRYNKGDNTNLALHLKNLSKQLDVIIIVNAILPSPNRDYGLIPQLNDLGRCETGSDWDVYCDVILGLSSAKTEQKKERGSNWDFARGINVEIMKNNFGREGNIVELFYEVDRKMVFSYEKKNINRKNGGDCLRFSFTLFYLGFKIIATASSTAKMSIFRPVAPSNGFNAAPCRDINRFHVMVCITRYNTGIANAHTGNCTHIGDKKKAAKYPDIRYAVPANLRPKITTVVRLFASLSSSISR